jgi:hypothetical protein
MRRHYILLNVRSGAILILSEHTALYLIVLNNYDRAFLSYISEIQTV